MPAIIMPQAGLMVVGSSAINASSARFQPARLMPASISSRYLMIDIIGFSASSSRSPIDHGAFLDSRIGGARQVRGMAASHHHGSVDFSAHDAGLMTLSLPLISPRRLTPMASAHARWSV